MQDILPNKIHDAECVLINSTWYLLEKAITDGSVQVPLARVWPGRRRRRGLWIAWWGAGRWWSWWIRLSQRWRPPDGCPAEESGLKSTWPTWVRERKQRMKKWEWEIKRNRTNWENVISCVNRPEFIIRVSHLMRLEFWHKNFNNMDKDEEVDLWKTEAAELITRLDYRWDRH